MVKFGESPLTKLTHKEMSKIIKRFESFEVEEDLIFEISSYLNLHGDDDYDIEQVEQDDRHEYKYVDGIKYELSIGGDDVVVDVEQVVHTDENMFYEDQIERYIEYFEDGGICQTFPVQVSQTCLDLECMLEFIDSDDSGFDIVHELFDNNPYGEDPKTVNPKMIELYMESGGYFNIISEPENYGFHNEELFKLSDISDKEDLDTYYYDYTDEEPEDEESGEYSDWEERMKNYDEDIYDGLVAIMEYFSYEKEYTLTDFNHRFAALVRMGKKQVMVEE
jgi:hypothetical protein